MVMIPTEACSLGWGKGEGGVDEDWVGVPERQYSFNNAELFTSERSGENDHGFHSWA